MSSNDFDLVLCGGGVIGLSIAYQCAQQGWKVAVVDRADMGTESSWAGAGILPSGATFESLDPIEQLRALSHSLHPIWHEDLLRRTGIDNEFRRCGGLYLGRSRTEQATLRANEVWLREHGVPFSQLRKEELLRLVPGIHANALDDKLTTSWWLPNDCRVRNPRHLKALIAANRLLGVCLIENQSVIGLEAGYQSSLRVLVSQSEPLRCHRVCVTAGAWTPQLLQKLTVQTGILPVRGQMILLKQNEPLFPFVINEGHRYLVPRDDGHLLIGSCEEEVGYNKSTTDEMLNQLREWAFGLIPSLKSSVERAAWSGLRPGSFDSYPYMGEVPGLENVFVAAGHFRHGLHWSTGTALLMQQIMFRETTSISMDPFRLLRGHNATANASRSNQSREMKG